MFVVISAKAKMGRPNGPRPNGPAKRARAKWAGQTGQGQMGRPNGPGPNGPAKWARAKWAGPGPGPGPYYPYREPSWWSLYFVNPQQPGEQKLIQGLVWKIK